MKKQGFTLAEVLITLGIIGVVAALTTPALIQNVNNSKVGPTLSKAVATFENACQTMLTQEGTDSISAFIGEDNLRATTSGSGESAETTQSTSLGKELGNYMKITKSSNAPSYTEFATNNNYNKRNVKWDDVYFKSEDGMAYYIITTSVISLLGISEYPNIPTNQKIGEVYIDINDKSKPNKQARDIFRFHLYNDGTLRPFGGNKADRTGIRSYGGGDTWGESDGLQTMGEPVQKVQGCNSQGVKFPDTCAGSIFDNGFKVIYK